MGAEKSYTSLVTAEDAYWRRRFATILIGKGLDVHTACERSKATDLLRKHQYDVVVADQSIGEPELLEFALTIQDMKSPMPVTLIADDREGKHRKLWERINVFFAGGRRAVASKLDAAVACARGGDAGKEH